MIPLRIASLVPSVTELVVALGLGPHLVARTGFCIHPRELLAGVPKVGGTKDVDLARLRALAPTHVVLNIDENRAEAASAMVAWGPSAPELVITHPKAPEDNLALVDQLAAAFGAVPGVAERAAALKQALAAELAATRPDGRPARQVLYLIWRAPWMSVARDTYLSRMLARVHWQTLPALDGGDRGAARYPVLSGREPWLAAVELVLLSSEPFRFTDAHRAEAQRLAPQARVQRVDGELLSWYGPRAVPGLAYLRELADACG
jgi:ABC-type Fe3+-hydroxamate transport system substrate-binding protein